MLREALHNALPLSLGLVSLAYHVNLSES